MTDKDIYAAFSCDTEHIDINVRHRSRLPQTENWFVAHEEKNIYKCSMNIVVYLFDVSNRVHFDRWAHRLVADRMPGRNSCRDLRCPMPTHSHWAPPLRPIFRPTHRRCHAPGLCISTETKSKRHKFPLEQKKRKKFIKKVILLWWRRCSGNYL